MSQYSLPPDGFDKLSIMSHFRNFLQVHGLHFKIFYGNDEISSEEISVREQMIEKILKL